MTETLRMLCPLCDAKLKVRPEKAGSTAKCPGCHQLIVIDFGGQAPHQSAAEDSGSYHLPATEQQKELARSLGFKFSASITHGEISELIEIGTENQQSQPWTALNSVVAPVAPEDVNRDELPGHVADDPQVSTAGVLQSSDQLYDQEKCAVLVTLPFDEIESFSKLQDVQLEIASGNSVSGEEAPHMPMSVAFYL